MSRSTSGRLGVRRAERVVDVGMPRRGLRPAGPRVRRRAGWLLRRRGRGRGGLRRRWPGPGSRLVSMCSGAGPDAAGAACFLPASPGGGHTSSAIAATMASTARTMTTIGQCRSADRDCTVPVAACWPVTRAGRIGCGPVCSNEAGDTTGSIGSCTTATVRNRRGCGAVTVATVVAVAGAGARCRCGQRDGDRDRRARCCSEPRASGRAGSIAGTARRGCPDAAAWRSLGSKGRGPRSSRKSDLQCLHLPATGWRGPTRRTPDVAFELLSDAPPLP